MAFLLDTEEQKIEYVYPFICGLCGFGSGNIDTFHHHFETHSEDVPSCVFHLCEYENQRNDESDHRLDIGSYTCKTCNHTFATVCHLLKHLDNDSSTDKYIMDLQTKTAYPLTSQCASVYSHSFLNESINTEDEITPRNKSQSGKWSSSTANTRNIAQERNKSGIKARGGKFGPKETTEQKLDSHTFEELLQQAQSNHTAAATHSSEVEDLDYNADDIAADDNNDDSNIVSLVPEVTVRTHTSEKTKRTRKRASQKLKPGEWLNCKHCGLSFKKQSKRTEHEEEHITFEGNSKYAPEKLYTCEKCGCVMLKFRMHLHRCPLSERVRRPHVKGVKSKKTKNTTVVSCPYCNKKVKRYILPYHVIMVHQEQDPIPCEFCGKLFKHKYSLSKHRALHIKEKRFSCSKCTKTFYSRSKLRSHMIMHGEARNYQCKLCPAKYKYSTNLKIHMERFHSGSNEKFQCQLCPKQYSYRDGLAVHIKRIHKTSSSSNTDGAVKTSLDQCGKEVRSKKGLSSDTKDHENEEDKLRFLCDECPCRYASAHSLKRHKERKHKDIEPASTGFKCDSCPKVYTNVDALRMHKYRNHRPGDSMIRCAWKACRQKFKLQSEAEGHLKSHKDAIDFFCTECNKSFMTLRGLSRHCQRLHPKIYKLPEMPEIHCDDQTANQLQTENQNGDIALSSHASLVENVDSSMHKDDDTTVMNVQSHLEDHAYIDENVLIATPVISEDCQTSVPVNGGDGPGIVTGDLSRSTTCVDRIREDGSSVRDPSTQKFSNQRGGLQTDVEITKKSTYKLNVVHVNNQGTSDTATSKIVSTEQNSKGCKTIILRKVTDKDAKGMFASNVATVVKLSVPSGKR